MFEFADGVRVTDEWDGRAAWRGYRFLRAAPLRSVLIDPDDKLVIDPLPANNGRLLEPDKKLANRFGVWLTLMVQWLALGVSWL